MALVQASSALNQVWQISDRQRFPGTCSPSFGTLYPCQLDCEDCGTVNPEHALQSAVSAVYLRAGKDGHDSGTAHDQSETHDLENMEHSDKKYRASILLDEDFNLAVELNGLDPEWKEFVESVANILAQKAQAKKENLPVDLTPLSAAYAESTVESKPQSKRPSVKLQTQNKTFAQRFQSPTQSPSRASNSRKRSFQDDSTYTSRDASNLYLQDSNGLNEGDSDAGEKHEDEEGPAEMRQCDLNNPREMRGYYEACLRHIQQTQCRRVGQDWVKAVHPKKQANYPYSDSKNKDRETPHPPWWPAGVPHKEPAHIKIEPRMTLLLHIICNLNDLQGTGRVATSDDDFVPPHPTVADLKKATDENIKIAQDPKAQLWLKRIYDVRRAYERAKDRPVPGTKITMPWPPKRKARRSNNPQRRKTEDARTESTRHQIAGTFGADSGALEGGSAGDCEHDDVHTDSEDESSWIESEQDTTEYPSGVVQTDTTSTSASPPVKTEGLHPKPSSRAVFHDGRRANVQAEPVMHNFFPHGQGVLAGHEHKSSHPDSHVTPVHVDQNAQHNLSPWGQSGFQPPPSAFEASRDALSSASTSSGAVPAGYRARHVNQSMHFSSSADSQAPQTPMASFGGERRPSQQIQDWPQPEFETPMFPTRSLAEAMQGSHASANRPGAWSTAGTWSQSIPHGMPQMSPPGQQFNGPSPTGGFINEPMSPNTADMSHTFQGLAFGGPQPMQHMQHQQAQDIHQQQMMYEAYLSRAGQHPQGHPGF